MRSLQFFFDVVSPYAWLGWHELNACRRRLDLEVDALPVLFGVLLDARGGVGPAELPEKRAYTFRDVQRCIYFVQNIFIRTGNGAGRTKLIPTAKRTMTYL